MKSITVRGVVTSTSNKQSGKFEQKNPKKSLFFTANKEDVKKLEDFGLTQYTSKADESKGIPAISYFQVKMSEEVKRYKDKNSEIVEKFTGNIGTDLEPTPNYTSNEKEIELALIQGESQGNKFIRVFAILCDDGIFTENEVQNPFA